MYQDAKVGTLYAFSSVYLILVGLQSVYLIQKKQINAELGLHVCI